MVYFFFWFTYLYEHISYFASQVFWHDNVCMINQFQNYCFFLFAVFNIFNCTGRTVNDMFFLHYLADKFQFCPVWLKTSITVNHGQYQGHHERQDRQDHGFAWILQNRRQWLHAIFVASFASQKFKRHSCLLQHWPSTVYKCCCSSRRKNTSLTVLPVCPSILRQLFNLTKFNFSFEIINP